MAGDIEIPDAMYGGKPFFYQSAVEPVSSKKKVAVPDEGFTVSRQEVNTILYALACLVLGVALLAFFEFRGARTTPPVIEVICSIALGFIAGLWYSRK